MDVLHGDLHTKNILVDRNNEPWIIDWDRSKDKAIASEKYKDVGRLIQTLEKRVPGSLLREWFRYQNRLVASSNSKVLVFQLVRKTIGFFEMIAT